MSIFLQKQDDYYVPNMAGYVLLVVIILALLIVGAALSGRGKRFTAKQIAFSGVAIALGTVTSMIKLFEFPMGGAMTLFSMLFVTLVGYWYGTRMGITAAVAYGLLQLILGPYIINPVQPIVDYILAFGALGLSGVFSKSKNGLVKGYILGVIGRYFFAFLSGVIFFSSSAAEYGFTGFFGPALYSLVYNGIYIGAEAAITLVLLAIKPVRNAMASVKVMANS
ncbi:MAG: energy-coupled thiamine transporter ThiT [Lachnospiraceae bacterium]|jgi:thiamine transporter|nr:energy-coupled thiamine transporter ThiT [Lachnospiraceae bacterium]MDY2759214.1 energy-coupled thiamine transporter ThiT [Lachnospiraceae bacterium]